MELDLLLVRRTTELTPLAGRFGITKSRIPSVIRSWLGSSVLCKAGLNEECFQRRRYRNLRDVPDWTNPPLESPDSPDDNEEYLTGEAGEDNDAKQGERSSPSVKYGTGSVSRMSVKKEEEVKNQEGKGLSALERFRLAAGAAAEASNSPTGSPVKIPPPPSELPRTHGATSKLKLASSRLRTGDSGSLHDSKSDTSHLASHLSNATTHQENNVTHFARSKIFSNDHFPKPSAPPYDQ
uniref:Uncharacterized protein n=1 Tax=Bigelowiella natans TaxID=227086 RepID=A0A6T9YLX4_BIGNA|mmetsp:Transcript_858/g.1324  ORF Transcript_858/g.1324 Transcript_858/m.1324 type:complete len:238 (+) Transcript_858:1111-1824(+)